MGTLEIPVALTHCTAPSGQELGWAKCGSPGKAVICHWSEKDMVSRDFLEAGGCAGCRASWPGTLWCPTAEGSLTCVWK